jgi:ABC-2 type transport system ATP-binding protein
MSVVDVKNITKSFGSNCVVDQVSFDVQPGEIMALLGPNGAGKTTIIRMILDIFQPDSGQISVLDGPMTEKKKDLIGYLPEERGLYQDITLDRCLTFLASLKGMQPAMIKSRLDEYYMKFELQAYRNKKVKELSKGMQQKAQLITTLIHDPKIIIVDEPFSALDPVNTQMVKDLLIEKRKNGVAIILCTHQMHHAEELCDRLVLVDKGKAMLYGPLEDIRRQFAKPEVYVKTSSPLPDKIKGITEITVLNGYTRLTLSNGFTPQAVLKELVKLAITIEEYEIAMPKLDEIFIQVVQGEKK